MTTFKNNYRVFIIFNRKPPKTLRIRSHQKVFDLYISVLNRYLEVEVCKVTRLFNCCL